MTGGPRERPGPVVRSSGWPPVPAWLSALAAHRRQSGGADVRAAARLAVPGLAGALAAGRFAVAAFDPMAPFQPAPTVPEARPGPDGTLAAQEVGGPDGFRYPEDAR